MNHHKKRVIIRHYPFLFVIFLVLVNVRTTFSQPDSTLIAAYEQLLDLRIRSSEEKIQTYLARTYNDPLTGVSYDRAHEKADDVAFITYIRSLTDLFRILLLDDQAHYVDYTSRSEKDYLNSLDTLGGNYPYTAFSKAEIRLHSSLIHLSENKRFNGAIRLIQAFNQSEENINEWRDLPMMKKTDGLLQIILSLVPDKYNFFYRIMGIRPDFNNGYQQILQVSREEGLFRFEGRMLLALINAYYLDDFSTADSVIHIMEKNYHNSLLFNYLAGVISIKTGGNEAAVRFLETASEFSEEYQVPPLVDYYLGECYLRRLDLESAADRYKAYVNRHESEKFIKDSYYKLYLISFQKGDSTGMREYSTLVREKGDQITEKDKNVLILIDKGYKPHPELLKARFLFDGGYYNKAQKVLNNLDVEKLKEEDKMEWNYRYARIFELTLNPDQAEIHFYRVINFSGFEDHHLVANSYLHLGYLALERENYQRATHFFEQALDYDGEIYSQSIRREALAGLEQIPD